MLIRCGWMFFIIFVYILIFFIFFIVIGSCFFRVLVIIRGRYCEVNY